MEGEAEKKSHSIPRILDPLLWPLRAPALLSP